MAEWEARGIRRSIALTLHLFKHTYSPSALKVCLLGAQKLVSFGCKWIHRKRKAFHEFRVLDAYVFRLGIHVWHIAHGHGGHINPTRWDFRISYYSCRFCFLFFLALSRRNMLRKCYEHSSCSCLRRGRFFPAHFYFSICVAAGKLHVFGLLITFVVLPKKTKNPKNKVKTRSVKTTDDMKRKLWQLWCHVFVRRRI